ncbi:hypothetical protein NECID01_1143 [Nematocida sp. AWRm77]|nr:hypothetical protein NECID01_1143 [Nematocida sp. AWRm77]
MKILVIFIGITTILNIARAGSALEKEQDALKQLAVLEKEEIADESSPETKEKPSLILNSPRDSTESGGYASQSHSETERDRSDSESSRKNSRVSFVFPEFARSTSKDSGDGSGISSQDVTPDTSIIITNTRKTTTIAEDEEESPENTPKAETEPPAEKETFQTSIKDTDIQFVKQERNTKPEISLKLQVEAFNQHEKNSILVRKGIKSFLCPTIKSCTDILWINVEYQYILKKEDYSIQKSEEKCLYELVLAPSAESGIVKSQKIFYTDLANCLKRQYPNLKYVQVMLKHCLASALVLEEIYAAFEQKDVQVYAVILETKDNMDMLVETHSRNIRSAKCMNYITSTEKAKNHKMYEFNQKNKKETVRAPLIKIPQSVRISRNLAYVHSCMEKEKFDFSVCSYTTERFTLEADNLLVSDTPASVRISAKFATQVEIQSAKPLEDASTASSVSVHLKNLKKMKTLVLSFTSSSIPDFTTVKKVAPAPKLEPVYDQHAIENVVVEEGVVAEEDREEPVERGVEASELEVETAGLEVETAELEEKILVVEEPVTTFDQVYQDPECWSQIKAHARQCTAPFPLDTLSLSEANSLKNVVYEHKIVPFIRKIELAGADRLSCQNGRFLGVLYPLLHFPLCQELSLELDPKYYQNIIMQRLNQNQNQNQKEAAHASVERLLNKWVIDPAYQSVLSDRLGIMKSICIKEYPVQNEESFWRLFSCLSEVEHIKIVFSTSSEANCLETFFTIAQKKAGKKPSSREESASKSIPAVFPKIKELSLINLERPLRASDLLRFPNLNKLTVRSKALIFSVSLTDVDAVTRAGRAVEKTRRFTSLQVDNTLLMSQDRDTLEFTKSVLSCTPVMPRLHINMWFTPTIHGGFASPHQKTLIRDVFTVLRHNGHTDFSGTDVVIEMDKTTNYARLVRACRTLHGLSEVEKTSQEENLQDTATIAKSITVSLSTAYSFLEPMDTANVRSERVVFNIQSLYMTTDLLKSIKTLFDQLRLPNNSPCVLGITRSENFCVHHLLDKDGNVRISPLKPIIEFANKVFESGHAVDIHGIETYYSRHCTQTDTPPLHGILKHSRFINMTTDTIHQTLFSDLDKVKAVSPEFPAESIKQMIGQAPSKYTEYSFTQTCLGGRRLYTLVLESNFEKNLDSPYKPEREELSKNKDYNDHINANIVRSMCTLFMHSN